jgi:uncharacterized protein (TIGR03435 family)
MSSNDIMRFLAGTFLALLAAAQPPERSAQFEVASIKPSPPPTGRGMRVWSHGGPGTDDPSMYTCENYTLLGLIWEAFDIQSYQLSGPDWLISARFNVSAKIPPGTTKEQFRIMRQNLLAERFKLTSHRAQKEMTVFNLVVGKNGPKFKEYVDAPAPADDDGTLKKDANGFPLLPRGKGGSMAIMGNRAALHNGGGTMTELAVSVANQLRQPVTDATGLTGKYEIEMYWVPGEPRADDPGPSIFQALQDQLGLKLESKKGMIDILVVDHIEKTPTEN